VLTGGLLALGIASAAQAQVATTDVVPGGTPGWTFAAAPYLWTPTIGGQMTSVAPNGQTVTTNTSISFGDYLSDINFAAQLGGAARYDRFSILTDLVYMNQSMTGSETKPTRVNPGTGPIDIPAALTLGTGTHLSAGTWSLAGGYTVLSGDWGNIDAVAGIRMLFINSTTNLALTTNITTPNGSLALGKSTTLTLNTTKVEGIGGITGRINIPNSQFYIPFYLDAGGGAVPFTWQAYAAIAYKASSWADVSAGYRYMMFQNGSSTQGVQHLDFSGLILAANIKF